jgi:NAD+ kinase
VNVLVIYKKSAYQIYVEEHRHEGFSKAIAHDDSPQTRRLVGAHSQHEQALDLVKSALSDLGVTYKMRHRTRSGHAQHNADLVVSVGGDGTVLEAARYTDGNTPLLAINSAPGYSVGYFCARPRGSIRDLLEQAVRGFLSPTKMKRMRVAIDGEVRENRVLNDILFCHHNPAATSRYDIELPLIGRRETHRSSGVWVGTPAGSYGATWSAGGSPLPIDVSTLQYVVRELCKVQHMNGEFIARGFSDKINLTSHMRTGRIYVDGSRYQYPVRVGSTVECSISDEPLTILGFQGWSDR